MKYVCMEDIENLAAQGKKELILDENTVLMDLARDMAHQLGIVVVVSPRSTPHKAASPAAPSSPAKAALPAAPAPSSLNGAPKLGDRPSGCQHGPLAAPALQASARQASARQARSNNHHNSDGVVNELVDLIRQSTGKQSGK